MFPVMWRYAIVAILLFAAFTKIVNPASITRVLLWDGVPRANRNALIWTVVLLEVILAGWLLVSNGRMIVVITLLVFVCYTAQLIKLYRDPSAPSCGCMQLARVSGTATAREHLAGIIRNACVVTSGFFALARRPKPA